MTVTAPGKVVLLGEYAVLDGAPAIVAAVDRGVRCTVTPADAVVIEVPGGDDRFVRAALEATNAPPGRYTFTDHAPVPSDVKVGLGGSAAATVAAVRAVLGAEADPATVHRVAFEVHHAVQGSGSGIDVAASAYGGVLRFEAGAVTRLPPVTLSVVFTGRSARTGPRVQRYLAWGPRDAFVAASRAVVDGFEADPLASMAEGGRLLRAMAEQASIPYWTPEIDDLVRMAAELGGAAKPSGAGGGDVVVALFGDDAARVAFEATASRRGYLPVEVTIWGSR